MHREILITLFYSSAMDLSGWWRALGKKEKQLPEAVNRTPCPSEYWRRIIELMLRASDY